MSRTLRLLPLLVLAACVSTSAPADDVEQVTSESALVNWLGDHNYVVQQTGFSSLRLQGTLGTTYRISGFSSGALQAWTFGSEAEASRAVSELRTRGGSQRRGFDTGLYQSGPLVVQFQGSDPGLRADLRDVLGSPR